MFDEMNKCFTLNFFDGITTLSEGIASIVYVYK